MPRVSVVMPVRNASASVAAAVRSIQAQTFQDWELLVVDDGSTDDSTERVQALTQDDARVRLLRQPARGIVAALEAGLAVARGECIARMDADDVCLPERLSEQVAYLEGHAETGVVGSLVEFGGSPAHSQGYALHVQWLNSVETSDEIALNRFIESPLAHPSVLFRRELLAVHGGSREGPFPEDYELWLRWMDAGVRVAKVPRVLVVWHDAPTRLSRLDPRYSAEAFFALKARYLAREIRRSAGGRPVWVWGAGRPTRARAELLAPEGIEIRGYIDIDPRKWGRRLRARPVVSPSAAPPPDRALVLVYVANRGARELIRGQLRQRGYHEGRDFWVAA
jgi:glycosyltransferase involved in cell wall biosynthesis